MSTLKIQFFVEEEVHPELYRALMSVSKNRHRAERLRVLATLGLGLVSGRADSQHPVSVADKRPDFRTDNQPQAVDSKVNSFLIVPMEGAEVKSPQHFVSVADKRPDFGTDNQAQAVDSKVDSSLIVRMTAAEVKEVAAPAEIPPMHPGMKLAMQMAKRGEFGAMSAPKPEEKSD